MKKKQNEYPIDKINSPKKKKGHLDALSFSSSHGIRRYRGKGEISNTPS